MPLAALVALATASPGATSSFRLPPSPSQRSRAADTPVIDHLPGGGPDGGHILSLAIVATRPSTVFAALRGGGVYASTDLGVTWTPADRGLPPSAWCNLVADPVNTSTLYAACYDGLYKTTDRGTLWRQLDINDPLPPVIAPSDSRVVYQLSSGGVLQSRDGGQRWRQVAAGATLPGCEVFAVDPSDSTTLYCSGKQWLSVSRDGGVTWRASTGGRSDAYVEALAIDPARPATMLASARDGRTFKTTTGGSSWFVAGTALEQRGFDELRYAGRSGAIVFARQGGLLLRSTDGGRHWFSIPSPWSNLAQITFAVDPADAETIYVGTSDGVLVTTDAGRRWAPRNHGITRASTQLVLHEGSPATLFVSTGRALFTSQDDGASWRPFRGEGELTDAEASSLTSDGAGGVLLRAQAALFHLGRNDTDWRRVQVPSGTDVPDTGTGPVPSILGTTGGGFVYRAAGETQWRSATRLPNGLVPRALVAAGPTDTLLASTGRMMLLKLGGIWRSDDRGQTWAAVQVPGVSSNGTCCGLVADPRDRNTIYALVGGIGIGGGGDQVLRSTDGGRSWSIPQMALTTSFSVLPTAPSTVVAQLWLRQLGTEHGPWRPLERRGR